MLQKPLKRLIDLGLLSQEELSLMTKLARQFDVREMWLFGSALYADKPSDIDIAFLMSEERNCKSVMIALDQMFRFSRVECFDGYGGGKCPPSPATPLHFLVNPINSSCPLHTSLVSSGLCFWTRATQTLDSMMPPAAPISIGLASPIDIASIMSVNTAVA